MNGKMQYAVMGSAMNTRIKMLNCTLGSGVFVGSLLAPIELGETPLFGSAESRGLVSSNVSAMSARRLSERCGVNVATNGARGIGHVEV